ncbi:hypothetical protein PINS_up015242 [Pythium insidiosum]|nr:hypothetical protein PINS_up015242 [Pythium insidiosum]
MELRKCCNHPFLIKGVEHRESLKIQDQADLSVDEKTRQITELLVTSSGKLVLLDKLLPRLKENGHRVLIFSQFKIMLDILQDYLRLRAYRCERIDGNITGNDRQAAIDRFCDPESSAFIMLLSTRAGGVGINLTAADTVIIYDSDWNPQNDLQAQARCHRIGQKKSVKIYRLLTAKTYELHMFHQASLKLGLDQAVLGSIRNATDGPKRSSTRASTAMSKDEIEGLLKHGAYEMFKEEREGEAEAASKRFSEESIDHILSRSTKIIHDPNTSSDTNESSKRSLMSSFSKATFVSSTNPDEQVALDDPDFWTKVVGLEAVDPSAKVEQSPLRKRRCRRQVKSYLQEDSDEESKASKKSRSKRTDADNEEFVISSDNDDEDEDDDETDELDDDDFVGGSKKKKSTLPNIRIFKDRVTDLLTSLGYGQWQDINKHCPALSKYPLQELQSLCHSVLTRLVRTAAAPFVSSKLQQRYKANSEQNPPIMTVVTPAERATLLDNFANKFRFVHAMLANMGMPRLSGIPFSEQITPSLKAERDAAAKLAQIDRMYTLQMLVRSHIGLPASMISLCRDYQQVIEGGKATKEEVLKLVKDGKLPDEVDLAGAAKPSGDDTTPQASPGTNGNKSGEECTTNAAAETPNLEKEASEERASSAQAAADPCRAGLNENVADSSERKDSESPKAAEVGDTPASEDEPKPADKDGQLNSEAASEGTKPLGDVATPSEPKPTAVEPKDPAPVVPKAALKIALRRLQGLPDIGDGESVCPWWVPLVDDVMLLLFVAKSGWIRARSAPPEFARANSVFGPRAAAHPVESWPSGPVLNRRIKTLLAAWSNERRVRTHVMEMEKKRLAELAAMDTSPDKVSRMGKPSGPALQQQTDALGATSQSIATPIQPQPKAPSTNDYASLSYIHAKRNRFAKLIHSFGIPETRLCRTDSEIRDKWRYFLEDEHLGVQHVLRTELLAEATDLEYCCRMAMGHSDQLLSQYVVRASLQTSILGGRRGFWRLSGTQCRRLIHRIDIFRMLRTHILVMPPKHLR